MSRLNVPYRVPFASVIKIIVGLSIQIKIEYTKNA